VKIKFIKQSGGLLCPASDIESDKMTRFKTGETYEIDIRLTRNAKFHGKVFKFFTFCYQHWSGERTHWKFQDEAMQFESFRKELIKLAGFTVIVWNIDGTFTIEAKSLAFSSMSQEEYESCYKALIQAAMSNIFNSADEDTMQKLYSFF
jgi:hypothetical protein